MSQMHHLLAGCLLLLAGGLFAQTASAESTAAATASTSSEQLPVASSAKGPFWADFSTVMLASDDSADLTVEATQLQLGDPLRLQVIVKPADQPSAQGQVLPISSISSKTLSYEIDNPLLTHVRIRTPDVQSWLWPRYDFQLIRILDDGSQQLLAATSTRITNDTQSMLLALGFTALAYLGIAYLLQKTRPRCGYSPAELVRGLNGRISLSNLQTFFFTLIVIGLLAYRVASHGELSELSSSVVMLLGIVAGGGVAARWSSQLQGRLTPVNQKYFQTCGWLPDDRTTAAHKPVDTLVTRNGELDVTRVQALLFSILVGLALLVHGGSDLQTFTVPESILTLLFASQSIYIGGKWVQPDAAGKAFTALNTQLDALRQQECQLRLKASPDTALDQVPQDLQQNAELEDYRVKAGQAADQLANLLGIPRPATGLFGVRI